MERDEQRERSERMRRRERRERNARFRAQVSSRTAAAEQPTDDVPTEAAPKVTHAATGAVDDDAAVARTKRPAAAASPTSTPPPAPLTPAPPPLRSARVLTRRVLTAALSMLCAGDAALIARSVFDAFDADGDGSLNPNEARDYLRVVFRTALCLNVAVGARVAIFASAAGRSVKADQAAEHFAKKTTRTICSEIDGEGCGAISLDEFRAWLRSFFELRSDAKRDALILGERSSVHCRATRVPIVTVHQPGERGPLARDDVWQARGRTDPWAKLYAQPAAASTHVAAGATGETDASAGGDALDSAGAARRHESNRACAPTAGAEQSAPPATNSSPTAAPDSPRRAERQVTPARLTREQLAHELTAAHGARAELAREHTALLVTSTEHITTAYRHAAAVRSLEEKYVAAVRAVAAENRHAVAQGAALARAQDDLAMLQQVLRAAKLAHDDESAVARGALAKLVAVQRTIGEQAGELSAARIALKGAQGVVRDAGEDHAAHEAAYESDKNPNDTSASLQRGLDGAAARAAGRLAEAELRLDEQTLELCRSSEELERVLAALEEAAQWKTHLEAAERTVAAQAIKVQQRDEEIAAMEQRRTTHHQHHRARDAAATVWQERCGAAERAIATQAEAVQELTAAVAAAGLRSHAAEIAASNIATAMTELAAKASAKRCAAAERIAAERAAEVQELTAAVAAARLRSSAAAIAAVNIATATTELAAAASIKAALTGAGIDGATRAVPPRSFVAVPTPELPLPQHARRASPEKPPAPAHEAAVHCDDAIAATETAAARDIARLTSERAAAVVAVGLRSSAAAISASNIAVATTRLIAAARAKSDEAAAASTAARVARLTSALAAAQRGAAEEKAQLLMAMSEAETRALYAASHHGAEVTRLQAIATAAHPAPPLQVQPVGAEATRPVLEGANEATAVDNARCAGDERFDAVAAMAPALVLPAELLLLVDADARASAPGVTEPVHTSKRAPGAEYLQRLTHVDTAAAASALPLPTPLQRADAIAAAFAAVQHDAPLPDTRAAASAEASAPQLPGSTASARTGGQRARLCREQLPQAHSRGEALVNRARREYRDHAEYAFAADKTRPDQEDARIDRAVELAGTVTRQTRVVVTPAAASDQPPRTGSGTEARAGTYASTKTGTRTPPAAAPRRTAEAATRTAVDDGLEGARRRAAVRQVLGGHTGGQSIARSVRSDFRQSTLFRRTATVAARPRATARLAQRGERLLLERPHRLGGLGREVAGALMAPSGARGDSRASLFGAPSRPIARISSFSATATMRRAFPHSSARSVF